VFNKQERNQQAFEDLLLQKPGESPKYSALWFSNMAANMYIEEYKDALELLVSHIEKKRADNAIVYPVMLLYRHSIELALKESIIKSCESLGQEIPKNVFKSHNLESLVEDLEETFPDIKRDPNWTNNKNFFEKWESADLNGEFARYPRNTSGDSFKACDDKISISKIVKESKGALYTLDGVLAQLEDYMQKQKQNIL